MTSSSSPVDGSMIEPLPMALSSFVGRGRELPEVRDLLKAFRLVTLTGPPGIGKSRLAREVAARADEHFQGGAIPGGNAPEGGSGAFPRAVAGALSVQEVP